MTATTLGASALDELEALRRRIATREASVAVVGLGYVGIPVAASLAAAGFSVRGHDADGTRVAALRGGDLPLATKEPGLVALLRAAVDSGRFDASSDDTTIEGADVFIVAVDTPIDADHRPDTRNLARACRTVSERLRGPALVVVESTVAPGTMRAIAPVFAGRGAHLAHCPERLRPGRLLRNLRGMSRMIGVDDTRDGVLGIELYRAIVQAELVVTSWEAAEVIKTAENATRDVQIALANQLAVVCDHAGVDFRVVREHVNRLWSAEPLVLEAGPGVGGHCIPKDPWLLVSALPAGARADLIHGARAVNDAMAEHVVALALEVCADAGRPPSDAKAAVLGLTYDADSDDRRNAPGPRIADGLRATMREVDVHDPYATPDRDLRDVLAGADVAVLVVAHSEYRYADLGTLGRVMRTRAVVDCRRVLDADVLRTAGFVYRGLGLGDVRRAARAAIPAREPIP